MTTRFVDGVFYNKYMKTIGVDFLEKRQFIPAIHETVTFFLFDTAGQEEFSALTRTFYKGAGAAIVAFSTIDRPSFEAVPEWVLKVREECGQIPIILVQTKTDLAEHACVHPDEADAFAAERNLRIFRVCAKENKNIDEAFEQLCIDYVRRRRLLGGQTDNPVRKASDLIQKKNDEVVQMSSHRPKLQLEKDERSLFKCTIM